MTFFASFDPIVLYLETTLWLFRAAACLGLLPPSSASQATDERCHCQVNLGGFVPSCLGQFSVIARDGCEQALHRGPTELPLLQARQGAVELAGEGVRLLGGQLAVWIGLLHLLLQLSHLAGDVVS